MPSLFAKRPATPIVPVEIVLCVVFLSLTWPALLIRYVIRRRLRSLGLDDLFVFLAQLFFTLACACLMMVFHTVPGSRPTSPHAAQVASDFLLVHSAMYCCSILFLKLSLGIFFLRFLFSPWQRSLVYMAMIVSTLLNAFYLFWEIFNCGNPRTSMARAAANKCPPKRVEFGVAVMQAAGNVLTDIILTVMPVPLLWDTKMEWRVKVSVGFILVLATTGCLSAVARFWFLHSLMVEEAFMRCISRLGLATVLELGTGILAAYLATMKPLLLWMLHLMANSLRNLSQRLVGASSTPEGQDKNSTRRLSEKVEFVFMESKYRNAEGFALDGTSLKV